MSGFPGQPPADAAAGRVTRQRIAVARAAIAHLERADARIAAMITRIGRYRPPVAASPFRALISAVIQQQVSLASAFATERRVREACPGGRLTTRGLLALSALQLRRAGLSRQKAAYVRTVAECFEDGTFRTPELRRMTDQEIITTVTRVKGIGEWTAHMLLIFGLERVDVWPLGDLGLRRALHRLLDDEQLTHGQMETFGATFRPYRTFACWYLWRGGEGFAMPGHPLP